MLKGNRRTLIITSIIILVPMLIGLWLWDMLPNVMATHFGFNNKADGYSSKAFTVIGIPLILMAIQWLAAVVTSHDPKKQGISSKMFSLVLWIIPVISLMAACLIYPYNLGYKIDASFISEIIMGLLFIIIGNYMPKARQNYTIGVRVPWTLANEENWNRTHRLAGYLWVAGGILCIVIALTGLLSAVWAFAIIMISAVVPVIYSFWLHAKCGL